MQKDTFTILVVEDERPLLEAIRLKLESHSIETATCRSVQQALSYLEDIHSIDAIWLDHYLIGKESGLDLVVKIKADDSLYKSIPIFVVSNTASNEKVSAYMQLGIEKYYVKSNFRLDDIVLDIKEKLLAASPAKDAVK
jgi:CheY-like chemotaxis protein